MWLAMCFLFPELWEEFNGKCPRFEDFKSKYDGKDALHNLFIERLDLVECYANAYGHGTKRSDIREDLKINRDQFLLNVKLDDMVRSICSALIRATII